ncbi:NAD(P)H-binding protein [Clavibacter nebraskensis]
MHAVAYGDHDASVAALTCVTTLLMVSAAEDEHRLAQHVDFVDAAAESGVRDVVYTSFADACGGGPADRVHVGHSCEPRARHQLYIT